MMDRITIEHPDFSADIIKQGAQLIHFQPTGEAPFLWSAELSTYCEGKPFRGGIPICWPWFGKVQTPSHGFARILDWTLQARVDEKEYVALTFTLQETQNTLQIWPHRFNLKLDMLLEKNGVTMKFSVQTTEKTTGALHTYLWVEDSANISIEGLGECYFDALDAQIKHGCTEVKITQETDRIYTQPNEMTYVVDDHRRISIKHGSGSDVVLWNPWKKMGDMKSNDFRKMVCIETARINTPFDELDTLDLKLEKMESGKLGMGPFKQSFILP